MGRRFLILTIGLWHAGNVWAAFQVSLLNSPDLITVNRVASVNEQGLVFSRALGQSDFKRYHWGEFSLKGTQILIAELPGQSVFRQKSRADQSRYMDTLRNHMLELLPPPQVRKAVLPPVIERPPPIKPEIQAPILSKPAPALAPPAPIVAPPVAVQKNEKVVRLLAQEKEQANHAAAAEGPIKPLAPVRDPSRDQSSPTPAHEPFNLIPGPNIIPPDVSESKGLKGGLWFIVLIVIGLSVWAGREVAVFRNRPVRFVCLLSAVCPVIAPVVFLILPTVREEREVPALTQLPEMAVIEEATHITELDTRFEPTETPAVQVHECYRAGETRFSGKFFADYLARFYKAPPEDGCDLLLTTKEGAYPVHHISDLSPESMNIVYPSQEGLIETSISYRHLLEVRVQAAQIS